MARGTPITTEFLVEHYRPGVGPDTLMEWAGRIRAATDDVRRTGLLVRYVGAMVLPSDESLLCQFEAVSEEAVRAAYEHAGISFERISMAIRGPRPRRGAVPPPPCQPKGIR